MLYVYFPHLVFNCTLYVILSLRDLRVTFLNDWKISECRGFGAGLQSLNFC